MTTIEEILDIEARSMIKRVENEAFNQFDGDVSGRLDAFAEILLIREFQEEQGILLEATEGILAEVLQKFVMVFQQIDSLDNELSEFMSEGIERYSSFIEAIELDVEKDGGEGVASIFNEDYNQALDGRSGIEVIGDYFVKRIPGDHYRHIREWDIRYKNMLFLIGSELYPYEFIGLAGVDIIPLRHWWFRSVKSHWSYERVKEQLDELESTFINTHDSELD